MAGPEGLPGPGALSATRPQAELPQPRAGDRILLALVDRSGGLAALAGAGAPSLPLVEARDDEGVLDAAARAAQTLLGVQVRRTRYFGSAPAGDHHVHLCFADDDVQGAPMVVRFVAASDLAAAAGAFGGLLARFLGDDRYRGIAEWHSVPWRVAAVIALDRWGRVLLQLRDADLPADRFPSHWSLPGGMIRKGESPDEGALREFEEETGALLEEIRLFKVYRTGANLARQHHIYYSDPDLDLEDLECREGQALAYHAPAELDSLLVPALTRRVLEEFFLGTHYRAMFH